MPTTCMCTQSPPGDLNSHCLHRPNEAQICSCNNVTKKDITDSIKDGGCKSIGDVKSCTKAGTGCGGCVPLVQSIFNKTMADMGVEIKNHLCLCFEYSRADLFHIVSVKELETWESVMQAAGKDPNALGCEVCKPAVASILSSLWNKHIIAPKRKGLQVSIVMKRSLFEQIVYELSRIQTTSSWRIFKEMAHSL